MRVTKLLPQTLATLILGGIVVSAGCAGPDVPREREGDREVAKKKTQDSDEESKDTGDKPLDPPDQDKPKGPPPGPDALDPRLGDFAKERSLQEQERKALAEHYYKTGKQLFTEMRYRLAAAHLNRATALDPNLATAVKLRDRTLYILGDRRAEYKDAVRVMVEERLAKIHQARVEMERVFLEGEMLMKRQRYDRAQERFQRVLEAIRWFPYDIDREGLKAKAEARIARARRMAKEQERRRKQLLQEAARQAAEHEKAKRRRFRDSTLKALMLDAREAYKVGKYTKAIRICDQVLTQKPDHTGATDLKKEAQQEGLRKRSLRNYRDKVEAWQRQLEWIDASAVPYQQIFRFPDREQWMEIVGRDLPITALLAKQKKSGAALEITRKLDTQQISLNFDGTPFNEAIDFLRDITGLNFVITKGAKELIEGESVEVSLRLKNITLKNALNLILAAHENLKWRIEDGVVKIGTGEDSKEQLFLEFYDVNEIVSKPPDFPAPKLGLNLSAGGGGGGGGAAGGTLNFDDEDEKGGGVGVDSDKLIELIESKLGEGDESGSVEYSGGIIIVRKSLRAHQKIIKLLDALRRTVGVMVTVEARFVQVQDNLLEHLGVDIINQPGLPPNAPPDTFGQINNPRGLGGGPQNVQVGYNYTDAQGQANYRAGIVNALSSLAPAGLPFNITPGGGIALQYNFLDDFQLQAVLEAVRKTQKSRLINAPRLTVFNGQRSHILNIRQRAYIQDVEVNQTGVIPVLNPVIGILNTGAILEVRPTVSHDRRYVSLEVKPTLATELPARIPAPVTLANAFTSIPIELPVITIQKLRSTVTVPDGGTVLLGGLKNFDEFEGESGVPFLLRIPILNNLFRRKAYHKLRASLVVLLKADITIIREDEKRIFGR